MASERKFVTENIKRVLLKEYMMKETRRAGFGGLDIQRTPMGYRVTLITERPGLVIGRKGSTIKHLTQAVEQDFEFDNPQIEVQEVANPSLNSQIMAEKLASALERGWHFRRAGHSTVRRIMEAGARGVLVVLSGKLTGQRHRMEKFKEGHIKFCGEPKLQWIETGFAVAKMKLGIIGVKVLIMRPDAKLPDEVQVLQPVPKAPSEETVEPVGDADAPEEPAEEAGEAKEGEEAKEEKPEKPDEKKPGKRIEKEIKKVKKAGIEIDLEEDTKADILAVPAGKGEEKEVKKKPAEKKVKAEKSDKKKTPDKPKDKKPKAAKPKEAEVPKESAVGKSDKKETPDKPKDKKPKAAKPKEAEVPKESAAETSDKKEPVKVEEKTNTSESKVKKAGKKPSTKKEGTEKEKKEPKDEKSDDKKEK